MVGRLRSGGWRGGLRGVVSIGVYPYPSFSLFLFRAGGEGLKLSENEDWGGLHIL